MCNETTATVEDQVMEWIGFTGGFVLGVCLIPQIVQCIRTQSTADISYGWQVRLHGPDCTLTLIESFWNLSNTLNNSIASRPVWG